MLDQHGPGGADLLYVVLAKGVIGLHLGMAWLASEIQALASQARHMNHAAVRLPFAWSQDTVDSVFGWLYSYFTLS